MAIEWPEPIKANGMHYIKADGYMITKQGDRYQSSKQSKWVNLGPAMSLAEAKQLCEDDKGNEQVK
jgi:hypothetical protein